MKLFDKPKYQKEYFDANKDKIYARRKVRYRTSLEHVIKHIIQNCKQRHNVDITYEDVLQLYTAQEGRCALTGDSMLIYCNKSRTRSDKISIDRIDNDKGYSLDNIQLVTAKVNMARGVMSIEEFKDMCKKVINYEA